MPARRAILAAGPGLLAVSLRPRPLGATPEAMAAALRDFLGPSAPLPRPGRVTIDVPPLVENGNAVPLTVTVDSPMTPADHVRRIAVFNERNPLPGVIVARLGPGAGAARFATRIRLATSQSLLAVAEMNDGSTWSESALVIVTLAACVES
ncbi:MAG: SoxY-related AACIE arm protein [Acetobacteraceae bacterium]|nr:SoxY-related AACIE arm protein [Acetobacteraceae bacterium]